MNRDYQICKTCIMDTSDPQISFNDLGICNHCRTYSLRAAKELFHDAAGQQKLNAIVERIRHEGRNKKYDCIIGVSGGTDSTMVAYQCKQKGLRPLAVHLDNGWDTELAVSNIEKTLRKLGIDLYTHVIDWEEFRDLQIAYLRASVVNVETPTDHAITAVLLKTAAAHNIRYVVSGANLETEGVLPSSWAYDNRDFRNLYHIHKRFGQRRLKTFPTLRLYECAHYLLIRRIQFLKILNFAPYRKTEVIETLQRELGWVYYGGKHHESLFTRFFQGYFLPRKFGFDKRRAHLSNLICSNQIMREEALAEISQSPYSEAQMREDKEFVLKKLELTEAEFETILGATPRLHSEFPSWKLFFGKRRTGIQSMVRRIAFAH